MFLKDRPGFNPFRPVHYYIKIKIKLNCYFHTSLWCIKRFYEGLYGLHKTFWGTTKKSENKNLSLLSLFIRDRDGKSWITNNFHHRGYCNDYPFFASHVTIHLIHNLFLCCDTIILSEYYPGTTSYLNLKSKLPLNKQQLWFFGCILHI